MGDPVLTRTPWWQGFNCDECPAKYARDTCSLGNLPTYVVDAHSTQDVAAGVRFANRFNLRLVVKNTGHDFMGRNMGFGSLSIWTHHLKSPIHLDERWTPKDTKGIAVQARSAVTYGAGWLWREVSPVVFNAGKFVTSGTEGVSLLWTA
jgi:hypothetical protein